MRSLILKVGRLRRLPAKFPHPVFITPRYFHPSIAQASQYGLTPRRSFTSTVVINPGQSPEELLGGMVSNISSLSCDDVAQCFTTLGRNVKPNTHFDFSGIHFQSLIARVFELRDSLQGTAIGKILLGTAYLRYKDPQFIDLLYDIANHRFSTLSSRDIARVIISMHWLNYKNPKVLEQCMSQLSTILPQLDQHLLIYLIEATTSLTKIDTSLLDKMVTLIHKGELRDHQVVVLLSTFIRQKYYNQDMINSLIDRPWPQGIEVIQIREILRKLTYLYPHVNLPRSTIDLLVTTISKQRAATLQVLSDILEDLIQLKYQNSAKLAHLKRKTKFATFRSAAALESILHVCALLKENRESHLMRHFITEINSKHENLTSAQAIRLLNSLCRLKIFNESLIPNLCKLLRGKTHEFSLKQALDTFSTITALKYNDVSLFREIMSRAFSDPTLSFHDCYQIMMQMKKVMVEKPLRDALEQKLMMFLNKGPLPKGTFISNQFLPGAIHYLAISHSRHELVKVVAKFAKQRAEAGEISISNQIDALHYLLLLKLSDLDVIQVLWKNIGKINPRDLDYSHRKRLVAAYTATSAQGLSIDLPSGMIDFIKEGPKSHRRKDQDKDLENTGESAA